MQFQFQTGAIKRTPEFAETTMQFPMFQFQTGAIKSIAVLRQPSRYRLRFNSKLVRLKGNLQGQTVHKPLKFQFQTGAIKRRRGY